MLQGSVEMPIRICCNCCGDAEGARLRDCRMPHGPADMDGLIKSTMVTRQARIDDFTHEGTPPPGQGLELLCEDHVGTYVIPFLCRWNNGVWQSVASGRRIEATVVGWRVP